jgi:hypothetical protein
MFRCVGHGFGDYPGRSEGPLIVASDDTGSLPMGLAVDTNYWSIPYGPDAFQLATSKQNAANGVAIVVTTSGSGTQYIVHTAYA